MRGGILTVSEAASLIGISANSLRTMCREQLIQHMKVGPKGGVYRFRREWIDEYLESSQVKPVGGIRSKQPAAAKPGAMAIESHEFQVREYYKSRIKELKKQVKESAG